MWWRRWVSPVVGSTAVPGTVRALWERCMPRLEGDFLFCWTAMAGSWNLGAAAGCRLRRVDRFDVVRRGRGACEAARGSGGKARDPSDAKPAIIAQDGDPAICPVSGGLGW